MSEQDPAFLASLVAAAGEAIVSHDAGGRITTWNPAAEHLFGFTATEAMRSPVDPTVPPEAVEEWARFTARTAKSSTPQRLQTTRRCRDGTPIEVEIVAATIADGAAAGSVSIVRDVSRQTRADAAVRDLVAELRASNRQLKQLNATKTDFVSTISHEFRTPLTSIQGFSELLDVEDLSRDDVRAFARAINQNARRLGRLIGDVLDLDELESGHREIRRELLSLNVLVGQVLAAMASLTAGHRVERRLDPALPAIRGDAELLERVITNLVANAAKYSPAGGAITLATFPRPGGVELTIADEGIGVPPDHRETIFARYGRIARPEQAGIEGTGLGLPIARHILEVHNGRIWVEGNVPAGSIFHVVLPAAAAPATPALATAAEQGAAEEAHDHRVDRRRDSSRARPGA